MEIAFHKTAATLAYTARGRRMFTLIYIAVLFATVVCVVTVYAVTSAQDGIEDDCGFHRVAVTRVQDDRVCALPPDRDVQAILSFREVR
jgi:hypothetical protein